MDEKLFLRLQRMHDDQIIGPAYLALLLDTTEKYIYQLNHKTPALLPPRIEAFGRRLAWRLGTCRQWIRALENTDGNSQAPPKRIGRPRAPSQGEK